MSRGGVAGFAAVAAALLAAVTPAHGAVATKVKQETVTVENAGAAQNTALTLTGRLASRSSCRGGRKVKLESGFGTIASDRTNGQGRFSLPFSLSAFPDDQDLTASVRRKGATRHDPACKRGASTFDPVAVDNTTTFDYDSDLMQFSGTVSSAEPGCLQPRPWRLLKENVEQFSGTTEQGTGAWGPTPTIPAPSGNWSLGIGITPLDAQIEVLPGGGLRWPYCHAVNGLRLIS
jgi:hypothetical protein